MKLSYTKALTIGVLLALMAVSASVTAQTEAEKATLPPASNVQPAKTTTLPKGVNDALKATYINTCLPDCSVFSVGAGDAVALDAVTTIDCPAPSGKTCTITDDSWIELNNTSSTTNNPESLGFYLDSVDADFYYDGGGGTPNAPEFYDAIAHKTAVATGVSPGSHTVQTYTYSVYGANAAAWTATYRVYVP